MSINIVRDKENWERENFVVLFGIIIYYVFCSLVKRTYILTVRKFQRSKCLPADGPIKRTIKTATLLNNQQLIDDNMLGKSKVSSYYKNSTPHPHQNSKF